MVKLYLIIIEFIIINKFKFIYIINSKLFTILFLINIEKSNAKNDSYFYNFLNLLLKLSFIYFIIDFVFKYLLLFIILGPKRI